MTESKGVYVIWVGQDLAAYRQQIADALQQIATLKAQLAAGDKADAAMRALKEALDTVA